MVGFERAAHFVAARVGHDAEAAVLAAAFHHAHERRGAFGTRRRQRVELLDLREAHVDDGAAGLAQLARSSSGRRWIVCGPNTRSTNGARSRDGVALLARDTAAHADQDVGPVASLSNRHSPSRENTFSCAFSRTEQVLISSTSASFGVVRGREAVGGVERVGHAGGVVLVHLAAKGFDEVTAGHRGNGLGAGNCRASGGGRTALLGHQRAGEWAGRGTGLGAKSATGWAQCRGRYQAGEEALNRRAAKQRLQSPRGWKSGRYAGKSGSASPAGGPPAGAPPAGPPAPLRHSILQPRGD